MLGFPKRLSVLRAEEMKFEKSYTNGVGAKWNRKNEQGQTDE